MAQEFVSSKIKGDRVVLFMKASCPYCVVAKNVLSKYSFKAGHLEFVDISGRDDMVEIQNYFLDTTGARTTTRERDEKVIVHTNFLPPVIWKKVPRVFIGEQCVGGGLDVMELDNSGKLEEMLHSIGALQ